MKKVFALLLALLMVVGAVACTPAEQPATPTPAPAATEAPSAAPEATPEPAATGFEVALITDIGTIDDKSFNQGAWEGVEAYAKANGKTYKYYQPTEQSNDAYLAQIELAVKNGAKVIVTPGFLFETPIFIAQDQYPEVAFILLDGSPNDGDWSTGAPTYKTGPNTVGVTYAEQESGYLAGYAAVKDGYKKLGFMGGMAVPAVVRYGYGFAQGANDAAKELGVNVELMYHYTGGFDATPEAQNLAASWYNNGTEVIFACGGAVGFSVFAAAEAAGAKSIGVDVDQSGESDTVITSAMKSLAPGVEMLIKQYYDGAYPGGQGIILDASNDSVGLPMAASKFNTFAQADYDALFQKIANKEITIVTDKTAETADKLDLPSVKVTVVE